METKDYTALNVIHPTRFIQHNLQIEDGLEGMTRQLQNSPDGIKVCVQRIFRDGDYVFAHVETILEKAQISFNVFRFDQDKIVEHWDNIQEKQPLNLAGRSMIDGETVSRDLHKTEQNKALASQLQTDIFLHGRADQLASYFDGDAYIQHNPWLSDEIGSIKKVISEWVSAEKIMEYQTVHQVLGEGNFVLLMSEGYFHGAHTSFYDVQN